MVGVTDYVGIAALVAAFTGMITAVFAGIAALRATQTHSATKTNGDSRTIGEITSDLARVTAPDPNPPEPPAVPAGD